MTIESFEILTHELSGYETYLLSVTLHEKKLPSFYDCLQSVGMPKETLKKKQYSDTQTS
jgi:hypothetical protein